MRQLQTVVNMLTDANLLKQDIFALFIDFSSAFNTVYHDEWWLTMEMLGFERQCISAVRSLYTGASTSILIGGHKTAPVHIDRGSLQGDSLSPLLFIIAIEPMLRWLHTGGRGYSFASDPELAMAANAYADDLGTCKKTTATTTQALLFVACAQHCCLSHEPQLSACRLPSADNKLAMQAIYQLLPMLSRLLPPRLEQHVHALPTVSNWPQKEATQPTVFASVSVPLLTCVGVVLSGIALAWMCCTAVAWPYPRAC